MIRYVLDTKNLSLKIEPTENSNKSWDLVCFSNSNYAGEPVSRRVISGLILYVLSVLVSWGLKLQQSVSLSSSDAEHVALSEAVKEVMFVTQLLGSMKTSVKYSVMVRVDNINATFMASNITTKCGTKHIDIRYKYVNEYVEVRIVNIIFVKSTDNDSNILTKNLSTEIHKKHSKKMVDEKPYDVASFKNI